MSVGLWSEPDPDATTLAGAMVRSLVQPQLFEASVDGGWAPGAVEPGSDVDGPEARSASFRLRSAARWSDGTPISAADLLASSDPTFVVGVDQAADGTFTVQFNQPLPGWRRLWSGGSSIAPPSDELSGGPFSIESMVPGLETILVPNPTWWGDGPYLDRLRLVVVPDQQTQYELFERGELDVIAPWPSPGRMAVLDALASDRFDTAPGEGWWFGLTADPSRVDRNDRLALQGAPDVETFVGALLKEEAVAVESLGGTAADMPTRTADEVSNPIGLVAPNDLPLMGVAQRAVLLAIRDAGGDVPELRESISFDAEPWGRDADAYLGLHFDGPGGPCWTCRFGSVNGTATRLADAGGAPPDQLLADLGIVRVWFRPLVTTAWAPGVEGIVANGWALGPIWNADQWWRSSTD